MRRHVFGESFPSSRSSRAYVAILAGVAMIIAACSTSVAGDAQGDLQLLERGKPTSRDATSESSTAMTSSPELPTVEEPPWEPATEEPTTPTTEPEPEQVDSGFSIPDGTGQTLNVWMQTDTLYDIGIDELNAEFEAATGARVNFQEQGWGEYTTKLLTGLVDDSSAAPDVMEVGNNHVMQFAGTGAFLELDKSNYENSDTWLRGLEESSTYDGRLVAVPYYAGVRVGIVRSDLATQDGVMPPYDSLDDMQNAAEELLTANGDDGSYSGLFLPSQHWYAGMGFVWDYGGEIATQNSDGSWTAGLSSPESHAGLARLKTLYDAVSRSSDDMDEGLDSEMMAEGRAAMVIDPTWLVGVITSDYGGNPDLDGSLQTFAVPGHEPGTVMPQFIGGSNIDINANTTKAALARYYVQFLTGAQYQQRLADAGYIANSTSYRSSSTEPAALIAQQAATNGRFVPNTENWLTVEDARVLPNMFNDILTGAASIADATAEADAWIEDYLNAG